MASNASDLTSLSSLLAPLSLQTFAELLDTVDSLNVKIGGVLSAQESEFLRAYRAHMYGVKKEMAGLKEVASAAAATLARDTKVKEVEAARDWYRDEAVRLDDVVTRQKGELAALRERLGAQTQDALWQGERAREAAKQHTRLAAELEASRALGATAAAALGEEGLQAALAAASGAGAGAAAAAEGRGSGSGGSGAPVGTATLALLSPARRRALLESLGRGGSAASPAAGAAAQQQQQQQQQQPSERERALQQEVEALRAEVEELSEQLEAERAGGGAGGGSGSGSVNQFPAAPRRVLTPGSRMSLATPSTSSQTPSSVASQNLPPGLKPSSLKGVK